MRSIRSELRKTVLEIIFWFNFKINFNSLNNHKHTLSGPIHFLENPFHRDQTFPKKKQILCLGPGVDPNQNLFRI